MRSRLSRLYRPHSSAPASYLIFMQQNCVLYCSSSGQVHSVPVAGGATEQVTSLPLAVECFKVFLNTRTRQWWLLAAVGVDPSTSPAETAAADQAADASCRYLAALHPPPPPLMIIVLATVLVSEKLAGVAVVALHTHAYSPLPAPPLPPVQARVLLSPSSSFH
jgi:hypothetical protein